MRTRSSRAGSEVEFEKLLTGLDGVLDGRSYDGEFSISQWFSKPTFRLAMGAMRVHETPGVNGANVVLQQIRARL